MNNCAFSLLRAPILQAFSHSQWHFNKLFPFTIVSQVWTVNLQMFSTMKRSDECSMSVLSVSKLRDSNFLRPTTDLLMCTVPSFRVSAPRIFPGLMPTLTLPIPPRCRNMGTLSRPCRYDADSLLQLLTGSLRILRMLLTTTALQSITTGGGLSLVWTKLRWYWFIRTH